MVVSAHSRGALKVAEAATQHRNGAFTVGDVAVEVESIDRRQVLNVLDQLADQGYVRRVREGGRGHAHEFDLEDDPGLADVELPEVGGGENEISRSSVTYTWNFDFATPDDPQSGVLEGQTPAINVDEAVRDPGPPPTAAD